MWIGRIYSVLFPIVRRCMPSSDRKGGELLALGQERDVKAFEANARNCLGEVNLRETVAMRRKICEAVKLLITGKAPVISYGDI